MKVDDRDHSARSSYSLSSGPPSDEVNMMHLTSSAPVLPPIPPRSPLRSSCSDVQTPQIGANLVPQAFMASPPVSARSHASVKSSTAGHEAGVSGDRDQSIVHSRLWQALSGDEGLLASRDFGIGEFGEPVKGVNKEVSLTWMSRTPGRYPDTFSREPQSALASNAMVSNLSWMFSLRPVPNSRLVIHITTTQLSTDHSPPP